MSWRRNTLIALSVVGAFQLGALGALVLPGVFHASAPVAVFDPAKSLAMFVVWSNGRVTDEQFGTVLPGFQQAVQMEIDRLAGQTGQLIVRKDAVLSSSAAPVADVTEAIMEKVLNDAAF